jgi:4-amino-4-deoxy-L-arabinose transferase-like glycosyltransferase
VINLSGPVGMGAIAERLRPAVAVNSYAWLAFLLSFGALLSFWPGQTALPPSDRDEARFAQASRQMLETGDFADIRFQDEARHKKPVGIYWLQAGAAALAGGAAAPIAAYRAPSWIGAALAAGLTAWAVAPLIGWPAAAMAGALLAATALLQVEARIAKTDAVLLALIAGAMGALIRVGLDASRRWMARLFWALTGLGILVKGPIILIPAFGAIGWSAVAERGFARWRGLRPLEGAGLTALIAAPWLIAITIATDGAFWRESLGGDMLAKVTGGRESHGAPPGLYALIFWATAWPMAALAPAAAAAVWTRRREPAMRLLLGWAVPAWLLFELTPTKLPHYVLPAYPALAAMIAATLLTGETAAPGKWGRRAATVAFAVPAAALALGAAAAVPAIEGRWLWTPAALGAFAAGLFVFAARALWRWRLRRFLIGALGGAALVYAAAFGVVLPALESGFIAPRLAATAAPHRCGDGMVAISGFGEPSAVFALGTDTLTAGPETVAAALAEGRASAAFIEARALPAFEAALAEQGAAAEVHGMVRGFNYSKGRRVALSLFTLEDARCAS